MSEPIRVAVVMVTHQGRYLVGQRAPGTRFAGMSEFPGGKCEPGESFEDCARRECLEETGLELDSITPFSQMQAATPESADWQLKFFLSELAAERVVPDNCGSFVWLTYLEDRKSVV